jgi:hypothetical protein
MYEKKCPYCGSDSKSQRIVQDSSSFPIFIKYFEVAPDGDPDDVTDAYAPRAQYKICKTPDDIPSGVNYLVIATHVEIDPALLNDLRKRR